MSLKKHITANKMIDPKLDLTDVSKMPISMDGNFGLVYKGLFKYRKHHTDLTQECAIKEMKSKPETANDYEKNYQEILSMNSLDHPSLLPLLGYFLPFCGKGKCIIVTPFMKNGSLHQLLHKESRSQAPHQWTETTRAIIIIGIAAGLCYMHQQKMLHRDLKTDNILLDENYYPKICDFGFSKIFEDGLDRLKNATIGGTPTYMAPELLLGKEYNSKIDVFAYSMILYELIALKQAYQDPKNPTVFSYINNIMNGIRVDLDHRFPPFFKTLISDCWKQEPNERPSFVEILRRLLFAYKNNEIFQDKTVEREVLNIYISDVLKPIDINLDPDLDF